MALSAAMTMSLAMPAEAGRKATGKQPHRAAIDMGSSSFKMLVTDRRGLVVHDEKLSVGIGAGAAQHGLLLAPRTQLAQKTLAHFVSVAKTFGIAPRHIAVIATAAIRNAKGPETAFTRKQRMMTGRTFMKQHVRGDLGLTRAKILDGAQEALLGFQGALIGLGMDANTRVAILDTGGGSHQLTIGTLGKIEAEGSTQVGSNTVLEKIFTRADGVAMETIAAEEFDAADAKIAKLVPALPVAKSHLANTQLAAIGGTAKYLSFYFRTNRVTKSQLDDFRRTMGSLTYAERTKAAVKDVFGKRFTKDELRLLGLHKGGDEDGTGSKLPAKLTLLLRLVDLAGADGIALSPTDARHALVQRKR